MSAPRDPCVVVYARPSAECPFEPGTPENGGGLHFRADFAYDPGTSQIRSYLSTRDQNGEPTDYTQPSVSITISDDRSDDRDRARWTCGVWLEITGPVTVERSEDGPYRRYSFVLEPDDYQMEEGVYSNLKEQGALCSDMPVDPERFPDGLFEALRSQSWVIGWETSAWQEEERRRHAGGVVGIEWPDGEQHLQNKVNAWAYHVDDDYWTSGGDISLAEMVPESPDELPARGLYRLETVEPLDGSVL